jgi:polar amino acid transport system substrate-binding protein
MVACGGTSASHAEVVCVSENLCVRLSATTDLRQACYNTLGAIAMQGVRQADLRLGESCVVIGLGLVGQLTCALFKVSGVRVFGVDVEANAVKMAAQYCTEQAWTRDALGIADNIHEITGGIGADAVIITAATSSLDPINFAGELVRKRGRVVVVGDVPTGFQREQYYRKELDLRMSCSYGPGRYDSNYEEKGFDYPAAYVRWTENRNMDAFQRLLDSGDLDISFLTTHEFPLEDSLKAYRLILDRREPVMGIVLKYAEKDGSTRRCLNLGRTTGVTEIGIGFVGAGSYAQGNLLPYLPKSDLSCARRGVMTRTGTTSKRVAERFGFEFCTTDETDILGRDDINTVFVATRHDSHADYVTKAVLAGKNVFVEKPLAIQEAELERIERALLKSGSSQILMVGFNRRFAPLTLMLKESLAAAPVAMVYRVNAGRIDADSWIQDMDVGGGRIVGEVCHFIDLMTFLAGSLPRVVFASALPDANGHNDTVAINVEFENGSVGTINYYANGAKGVAKEHLEVYQLGTTAILSDFKRLEIHGRGRTRRKKLMNQNKGQGRMVSDFIEAIRSGRESPINWAESRAVTLASFAARQSVVRRTPVVIETVGDAGSE